jgi:hypothetical protein
MTHKKITYNEKILAQKILRLYIVWRILHVRFCTMRYLKGDLVNVVCLIQVISTVRVYQQYVDKENRKMFESSNLSRESSVEDK